MWTITDWNDCLMGRFATRAKAEEWMRLQRDFNARCREYWPVWLTSPAGDVEKIWL